MSYLLKIVIKMLWEIEGKKGIKYSDEIIAERKRKSIHIILKDIKWRVKIKILIEGIPAYFENIEDMIRFYYLMKKAMLLNTN